MAKQSENPHPNGKPISTSSPEHREIDVGSCISARKRKNSSSIPFPNKQAKLFRSGVSLLDLPLELFDLILGNLIPDPTDLRRLFEPNFANLIFVQPIAQVSRELRCRCLLYINRSIVWVRFRGDSTFPDDYYLDVKTDLPCLSAEFLTYLLDDTPKITIDVNDWPRAHESDIAQREYVIHPWTNVSYFPYNFRLLLQLLCELSDDRDMATELPLLSSTLTIGSENMTAPPWRGVHRFVRIAMNMIRNACDVFYTDDRSYYWDAMFPTRLEGTDVDVLLSRATDVLQCAHALEQSGLVEEAGLLLLHSHWMTEAGDVFLSHPADLLTDQLSPQSVSHDMAEQNQLRTILFHIESTACIYYHYFANTYGLPWWMACFSRLAISKNRFIWQPRFSWFGVTNPELGKWCYSKALTMELGCRVGGVDVNLGEDLSRPLPWLDGSRRPILEEALLQANLAVLLRPSDNACQVLRHQLSTFVGESTAAKAQSEAVARMQHEVEIPGLDGAEVTKYKVDPVMLACEWGNAEVMQYLPVYQQDIHLDQKLIDWSDTITLSYLSKRAPAPSRRTDPFLVFQKLTKLEQGRIWTN